MQAPSSTEAKYRKAMLKLIAQMTKATARELDAVFRTPEGRDMWAQDASAASMAKSAIARLTKTFTKLFADASKTTVGNFMDGLDRQSTANVRQSLKQLSGGVTIKIQDKPGYLKDIITAGVGENVKLIRSIPQEYMDRISAAVTNSIMSPDGGLGALKERIMQINGMTERRAENIAKDQTSKIYQQMSLERTKAAGVQKGKWIHSGGGAHPRSRHVEANGKEFDLSNGLPIGDNGAWVLPGQEINCRCTWVPIITFGGDDAA